jgi:mitochondrial cardiolipin hydrolase
MLRTVKKSLDIAIFSLSNDTIYEAVKEVWNSNCNVRIIADDECCNNYGSDIYRLAALGIPVKTDDSAKYHMHHKFAIIDESVVVTGSFNWTTQAVLNNQENILFIENKGLARQYTDEYNHLWNTFTISIDADKAKKLMEEQRKNRK